MFGLHSEYATLFAKRSEKNEIKTRHIYEMWKKEKGSILEHNIVRIKVTIHYEEISKIYLYC